MKRFVIILLVICLLLGCGVGYFSAKSAEESPAETAVSASPEAVLPPEEAPEETPEETPEEESAPAQEQNAPAEGETQSAPVKTLNLDALRELYAPEEIVGSVDGRDLSWEEYFYWLGEMGAQAQNYINTMAMYGQSLDWNDKLSADSEQTFAEYTVEMAQDCVRQLSTLEAVAAEQNVTLSAEEEAAVAQQLQDDILATCGEGADEEAFNAYLAENHVSRQMYDRMSRADYLFNGIYTKLYGENGASVSEADALAYLAENAYLSAGHILFSTVDDTYAPLDEETVAKKLEQAETVSAELRAIEDDAARAARFAELKAQYCEDPGREVYPEGYVFTPGTMVEEFEDAVNALADYEVSEPVLSAFGYHVIMRLPLSADATVSVSNDGTALTARSLYANEKFNEEMTARIESSDLTLRDDVAAIHLTDYLE